MNKFVRFGIRLKDYLLYRYRNSSERVNPHFENENFRNHLRVYQFASQFVSPGFTVLDIGCGTGYGSQLLAERGATVVGIDYSDVAIRFAKGQYSNGRGSPTFKMMSAEKLDFDDAHFDFIISSENFEHLNDQQSAAKEMARVLKPGGMALLGTPNPEATKQPNPFHTHECTFDELQETLGRLFQSVVILENTLSPRSDRGVVVNGSLSLWGKSVDTQFLNNTHSFMCFMRR